MRFNGTANPEPLGVLSRALEQYCDKHGPTDEEERENIAALIILLFGRGVTSLEAIVAAVEKSFARNERRHASAPSESRSEDSALIFSSIALAPDTSRGAALIETSPDVEQSASREACG